MKLVKLNKLTDLPEELQIKRLVDILERFNFPITLVIEENYQDREYKDIFYHFYASKFLSFEKDCRRVLILQDILSENQLLNSNFNLEEKIIGIVVLRPLKDKEISKTFINPKFLRIPTCYIRKTPFTFGMVGRKFCIDSFPFASQDGEYMTCAETSLWMILHYYGSRYQEYKIALPSEIVEIVDNNHYVRVLPSKGLYFSHSSMVLKKFGFSSQIYHRNSYKDENFKKYFHYYIESGIPLMVGISLKNKNIEKGHAIVCIGHGKVNFNKEIKKENLGGFSIINSADLIDEYVFMDDNKTPFEIRKYDNFDYPYDKTQIKYFIVPLYKRIFLDAIETETIFYEILKNKYIGLNNLETEEKEFVIRIYLTTSRNFKSSRFENMQNYNSKKFYLNLKTPKFIWVCEISTMKNYKNNKVIGEIVLDSTSSIKDKLNSLIFIRYQNRIAVNKEGNFDKLKEMLLYKRNIEKEFGMFNKNLEGVRND